MTIIDRMVPTVIADKRERLAGIRGLIAVLQRDIETQDLPQQVRRESLERVARWTLAANEMAKELARLETAQ